MKYSAEKRNTKKLPKNPEINKKILFPIIPPIEKNENADAVESVISEMFANVGTVNLYEKYFFKQKVAIQKIRINDDRFK
jgi:hypothetical protein